MKKNIIIGFCLLVFIGAGIAISQPPPIMPFILRFLDMTDTPAAYTGQAGKYVKVNAGEDAVEFGTPAGAGDFLADGSVPMTGVIDLYDNAAPTTNATGEIALDTTITDHQPLWQYYDGGENMTVIAIDTAELPATDNEIVKYDAGTDKFVLEADASGGVSYQQVVTVAKSGGDYATIQGAIDSIGDATTTKRYVVRVMSGVYTEAVTLKDYVDVIGAGRTNTIIAGTSGTVLTFPANKCTVSEVGINVDYGALGANSTAITSAGADSVLKDCDITVTKSSGDFVMNGITITAGSFRMSDCYYTYTTTGATVGTALDQSAVKQTGVVTNVIMNNNEMTISTTDTNDNLIGYETTSTVTGTCLLANNVISVDSGAAAASCTGIWAYGTSSGAIFNQNRLTVNCNASAYGIWIDSTAGGAVIDTRHNEIIVTSVGAAEGGDVAAGDTWNSTFDKITASTPTAGAGTIVLATSQINGGFNATGTIEGATLTEGGVGVPNTGDNLSVFAATTSAQLYGVLSDETGSAAGAPLTVFNQAPTIDSPTFTTAITATDLIDSAHYVADSIDNEHINWTDIDNLGDEGALVVADTADATSFPALFESATGTLAIKTDGGLTYNATTANLATTTFTGALVGNATTATTASAGDAAVDFFGAGVDAVTDATTCTDIEGTGLSIAAGVLNWAAASTDLTDTADLLYELELDTFAELDTQIADKALVNKADGAVWLGVHDFGGATVEIDNDESADAVLGNLGEIHIRGDEDRMSAHIGAGGEVAGEVTKSFLYHCCAMLDPGSWYDSDAEVF
jgi:hypothetical protein